MKNIIMSAVILMLVCCGEAEATSKKNITNRVVRPSMKMPETPKVTTEYTVTTEETVDAEETVILYLDDMTFPEAFALEHRAKGEGRTFWWKGNQYTTNLAVLDKFVSEHINCNETSLNWVTNNDDPNDYCKSNVLDDCGVCNGPGKTTWFLDKDSDGLGSFTEWITSCAYPTSVEIEKYQAESLQEGSGDQGVTKK